MIPTENYSSFKDYYIEKGANYHVKRQRLGYRSSVDGIELSLPAMLQNMKQKILEGKLKEYDNNNLPFAVIRSLIKEKGLDEKTVLLQIVKNPANFSDDYLKSTINYVLDDYNSYHGTTFNGDSNFLCFVCICC